MCRPVTWGHCPSVGNRGVLCHDGWCQPPPSTVLPNSACKGAVGLLLLLPCSFSGSAGAPYGSFLLESLVYAVWCHACMRSVAACTYSILTVDHSAFGLSPALSGPHSPRVSHETLCYAGVWTGNGSFACGMGVVLLSCCARHGCVSSAVVDATTIKVFQPSDMPTTVCSQHISLMHLYHRCWG